MRGDSGARRLAGPVRARLPGERPDRHLPSPPSRYRGRRRPAGRPPRPAGAAPAGPSGRRSTTGRRASRSPTCRSCARTGPTATTGGPREARLNALPAVPHRDRRARHPLPARALAARRRAAAGDHPRLARLDRRVPQGHRAADRPDRPRRRRRPTPSTSSCPSLPGYGFSDKPAGAGLGRPTASPRRGTQLMARLGYDRYGAQGGDWGARSRPASAPRTPALRRHPRQHAHRRPRPGDPATPSPRRRPLAELPSTTTTGTPATPSSSAPGPRRSATASSTPRPGRRRGSWRSSGRGPTATAIRRTCSPATSCSTT